MAQVVYGSHMKNRKATTQKTTLYLDSEDYQRLKGIAYQQGCAPAFLVREAVAEYVTRHAPPRPQSIGMGDSGLADLASRDEHYLGGMGAPARALTERNSPSPAVAKRRRR
jgi:hypothetical protein